MDAAPANRTLTEILGYDPGLNPGGGFAYYGLEYPTRDAAYLLFGGCLYEFVDCVNLLLRSRSRRKSPIFRALAMGVYFNVSATILAIRAYSSKAEVAEDFFRSPIEFAGLLSCFISMTLAKWAYFYGTVAITLAVHPTHKTTRRLVYMVAAVATIGQLCLTVVICHFGRLTFDQYLIYMETKDSEAVIARVYTVILPFTHAVAKAELVSVVTLLVFVVFTKIAFLQEIFRNLEVPFYEALRTMATTQSTQRIVTSGLWSVGEIISMWTLGMGHVTVAMGLFSQMFQLNTLAMLAFQGSSAIVNKYSTAKVPATVDLSLQMRTRQSAPEATPRSAERPDSGQQENL